MPARCAGRGRGSAPSPSAPWCRRGVAGAVPKGIGKGRGSGLREDCFSAIGALADLVEDEGLGEAPRDLHRGWSGRNGLRARGRRGAVPSGLRRISSLAFGCRQGLPGVESRCPLACRSSPRRRPCRPRSGRGALAGPVPRLLAPAAAAAGSRSRPGRRRGAARWQRAASAGQQEDPDEDAAACDRGRERARRRRRVPDGLQPAIRSRSGQISRPLDRPGDSLEGPADDVGNDKQEARAAPLRIPVDLTSSQHLFEAHTSLRRNLLPIPEVLPPGLRIPGAGP